MGFIFAAFRLSADGLMKQVVAAFSMLREALAKSISSFASCSGDFKGVKAAAAKGALRLKAVATIRENERTFFILEMIPDHP